jgi:hypothetical protein
VSSAFVFLKTNKTKMAQECAAGGGGGWDPLVDVDFFVVGKPVTMWLNVGVCRLGDIPHSFEGVLKQHPRFKRQLTRRMHAAQFCARFFEVVEIVTLAHEPSRTQQTSFFVSSSILDDDDVSLK